MTQDGATSEQPPGPPPTKRKSWLKKILGPTVGETNIGGLMPLQAVAKEFDQYLHYPSSGCQISPSQIAHQIQMLCYHHHGYSCC